MVRGHINFRMNKADNFCLILTTCPGPINAKQIAQHLLSNHKAACVNILPNVNSYFWWADEIEKSSEHLLIIKTDLAHYAEVEKIIKKLHEYEIPEVIAIPMIAGSGDYFDWIKENVQ